MDKLPAERKIIDLRRTLERFFNINKIKHMEIKNLERAAQIADELPRLEKARKMLSEMGDTTKVVVEDIDTVELPHSMNFNIISVLNMEINSLKEEAKKL